MVFPMNTVPRRRDRGYARDLYWWEACLPASRTDTETLFGSGLLDSCRRTSCRARSHAQQHSQQLVTLDERERTCIFYRV